MSVNSELHGLLKKLRGQGENLFPYLYNKSLENFNPQKDWVFYSGPYWEDEEIVIAMETLLTGKWIAAGDNVHKFEQAFSKKFNFQSSLMVNSGSSANLVMIAALKKRFGWNDGDEIIVSPVGFPTTIAPLIQNGLIPRFVDINLSDLNFDLNHVEKAINSKTRGIFLSPVLANTPDLNRIQEMCKKNPQIKIILDGCDSLGSKWMGKDLSEYAVATSCSFYPAHHITTCEGGMVSSNDEEIIKIARRFAWWGRDCYCTGAVNLSPVGACGKRFSTWMEGNDNKVDHKYLFTEMGYNLKPLDMQGSIGLVQLKKIDEIHTKRKLAKNTLEALFKTHLGDAISIPQELPGADTSWFGLPIICQQNKLKQDLVEFLEKNRIQTRNYFAGNILQHPGYHHLDNYKNFPIANRVLDEVFFIGCHPSYNDKVYAYANQVLEKFSKIWKNTH